MRSLRSSSGLTELLLTTKPSTAVLCEVARRCCEVYRVTGQATTPAEYYEKIELHHGKHRRTVATAESNSVPSRPHILGTRRSYPPVATRHRYHRTDPHNGSRGEQPGPTRRARQRTDPRQPGTGDTQPAAGRGLPHSRTQPVPEIALPMSFRIQQSPTSQCPHLARRGDSRRASITWLSWTLIIPVLLALWIHRLRTDVTEAGLPSSAPSAPKIWNGTGSRPPVPQMVGTGSAR